MTLLSVVIRLLAVLFLFVPKVRERVAFERKNASDPFARKFSADIAFEFSSEGEFQQVLPLITDGLAAGKKIELIYFSPSVEKGVRELCEKFPEQLRALRYPLLTGGFLSWISAPKLVLVRYDLFPEFLIYPGELLMVWVSFKKERLAGKEISWWKKKFLARATRVIYATEADARLGKNLGKAGPVFDFRIEQIERRLAGKEEKFKNLFPEYPDLGFRKFPREKRLLFGNAWPSDIPLLKALPDDFYVLVVPHKLTPEIISEFEKVPGVRVLNKKGVLCELYSDFGKAYVGGGFETSIHSVLEPLISGADQISCGPIHHRSTEFDLADSLGKISVVKNSQEFTEWLCRPLEAPLGHDKMGQGYPIYRKAIISC
jgi:3-deoxy-D-manno-octulosonic-acid transferase